MHGNNLMFLLKPLFYLFGKFHQPYQLFLINRAPLQLMHDFQYYREAHHFVLDSNIDDSNQKVHSLRVANFLVPFWIGDQKIVNWIVAGLGRYQTNFLLGFSWEYAHGPVHIFFNLLNYPALVMLMFL